MEYISATETEQKIAAVIKAPRATIKLLWRSVGKSGDSIRPWSLYSPGQVSQLPVLLLNCRQYAIEPSFRNNGSLLFQFALTHSVGEGREELLQLERSDVIWIFDLFGNPECRQKKLLEPYNPEPVLEIML